MSLLQARFEALKSELRKLGKIEYKGKINRYSAWEWLIFIPLAIFTLCILLFGIWWENTLSSSKIDELEMGTTYQDEQYQFRIVGDGWSKVEIGTFSDGSGEVELSGPLADMYFIVFEYDLNTHMDDAVRFRVEDADSDLASHQCIEKRHLAPTNNTVVSSNKCTGTYFGDPAIQISQFIWVNNRVFELYGVMSAARISYKNHEDIMINMAAGFYPL